MGRVAGLSMGRAVRRGAWLALFLACAVLAAEARAQDSLRCTDTDGAGFHWRGTDGGPEKKGFTRESFTVTVLSAKRRILKFDGDRTAVEYACTQNAPDTVVCGSRFSRAIWPIMFRGNRYERVRNFAPSAGGGRDLYVAYGTCTRF